MSKPEYQLTDKQKRFVAAVKRAGLGDDLYYDYSGRFMFGRNCPAVNVKYLDELPGYKKYNYDNMGLGMVIYCS